MKYSRSYDQGPHLLSAQPCGLVPIVMIVERPLGGGAFPQPAVGTTFVMSLPPPPPSVIDAPPAPAVPLPADPAAPLLLPPEPPEPPKPAPLVVLPAMPLVVESVVLALPPE